METINKDTEQIKVFDPHQLPEPDEKEAIIDFLFHHLENYGDAREYIGRAVDFALKQIESFGGHILVLRKEGQIAGCVVLNRTGMGGYIPENILVYIATHGAFRGQGLGKKLMNKAIEVCTGDIALHVEANNPARFLYEKVGFTNPYLEMRLKR
jgi:GNAT superfamily N-acetyltransferase